MRRYDGFKDEIINGPSASNWYYLGCFFVTVASVLGTGILALPVKTANSGFLPFFVVLIVVLIMELAVVIYTVEIMQKARALLASGVTSLKRKDSEDSFLGTTEEEANKLLGIGVAESKETPELNLHAMGNLFLHPYARYVFDFGVYLHFLSILISYVLAASEAWGELVGVHVNCQSSPSESEQNTLRVVVLVFGFVFTLAILLGQRVFTYVVSFLTGAKGSLLVVMVAMTAYVAMDIDLTITSDWSHIMESFLMCTVALGGAVNLMPLIFNKVPSTKRDVQKYEFAVSIGLVICAALISLWTFFVMKVVPQQAQPDGPSLIEAGQNGCISTIPLTEIIQQQRASISWIATVVTVFIQVSVTVSFITVGSGLKNFLDGNVDTFLRVYPINWHWHLKRGITHFLTPRFVLQAVAYFVSFALPIGFAIGKPSCFLVVLEYFTSAALNLENGVFIAYMMWTCSNYPQHIPFSIPGNWGKKTAIFVGLFFVAAVVYDMFLFFYRLIGGYNMC